MIHLIRCGYNFIHREGIEINRPYGSGDYAFVLFRSRAEVIIQGTRYIAEKNTYVLFRPETGCLYRELEYPFINDWFHCVAPELGNFLDELGFPLDQPIPAADPLLIARAIMDIQTIFRQKGSLCEQIIDADIRSLLMKLCNMRDQNTRSERTNRYFRQFSAIRNELYNSPKSHPKVEELAASINLSKSYFQHIYKDLFGCSVVTDMINSRLEYARYLLDNSTLPVAAIAKMCGYDNDTHFMRQFKKFVGATPSQYKSGRV